MIQNLETALGNQYLPTQGLIVRQKIDDQRQFYVESFQFDQQHRPFNFHPLTSDEAKTLAQRLHSNDGKRTFLQATGLLPRNVLHLDLRNEAVTWYSPARQRSMLFSDHLGIPNGKANVPALIWKADRKNLRVFAYVGKGRPTEKSVLYTAPFFNIDSSGAVCMGTVERVFTAHTTLDEFTTLWEGYFFNSFFSHLMSGYEPTSVPIVPLWCQLIESGEAFPVEVLKKSRSTVQSLLSSSL